MRSEEFLVVLDCRPAQVFIKELSRREGLEELLEGIGNLGCFGQLREGRETDRKKLK